ncbi:MAG: hypothetical protein WD397_03955 [Wenzhouxiangellaceae bacterium]
MLRVLLTAIVIFVLAGCAGPNPGPSSRTLVLSDGVLALLKSDEGITLADPRIKCEQSKGLGTNFNRRFCLTVEEAEFNREWSLRDAYGAGQDRVN